MLRANAKRLNSRFPWHEAACIRLELGFSWCDETLRSDWIYNICIGLEVYLKELATLVFITPAPHYLLAIYASFKTRDKIVCFTSDDYIHSCFAEAETISTQARSLKAELITMINRNLSCVLCLRLLKPLKFTKQRATNMSRRPLKIVMKTWIGEIRSEVFVCCQ